jgi:hypothetical protein
MTITQQDRLIATEVIAKAARNYAAGFGPEDRLDFDAVLKDRFPCNGGGGVSMANARTRTRIQAAIREFYEPSPARED